MTRLSLTKLTRVGVLSLGVAALSSSITLTPASHDFGQIVVGATSPYQRFQLTGTTPLTSRGVPIVDVIGADAAEFVVDSSRAGTPPVLQSSCLGARWAQSGSCDYQVVFRPQSIGKKTARLVVTENGQTAMAALMGEGIFSCRPNLVSCNYSDHYTGEITWTRVDSTNASINRMERQVTAITATVTQGVATCIGRQDDVEEDRSGGKLRMRSVSSGQIIGPGFFAVEFAPRGAKMIYKVSFACPTASLTHTEADYDANTNTVGRTPAEPAEWKQHEITDEHPAAGIGIDLIGKELDLTSEPVNDKGGYIKVEWSLKLS